MGPLKLLDFVGLDVAVAIGESLHARLRRRVGPGPRPDRGAGREGKLGRKSGEGFYEY